MDKNNQVFSKPRDSNWVPPIESYIESTITNENKATIPTSSNISPTLTTANSNTQSDTGDFGNFPLVLRRSEKIQKPPLYLKEYSL